MPPNDLDNKSIYSQDVALPNLAFPSDHMRLQAKLRVQVSTTPYAKQLERFQNAMSKGIEREESGSESSSDE
jgi:hypothetical protein